ncbi:hypothetical protein ABZ753_16460 [Streptomyces griseoincarnatus]
MISAITQDQPSQPPKGTTPDDEPQEAGVREEGYLYRDESRLQAGSLLRSRTMARRLPSLVRRSVRMAWRVDRGATIGLLVCQIGTGVLVALGLLAVTGTITALIPSGDITERLWDAAPQLAVIAAAIGLARCKASPPMQQPCWAGARPERGKPNSRRTRHARGGACPPLAPPPSRRSRRRGCG